MIEPFKLGDPSLETTINAVYAALTKYEPHTKEFEQMVNQLVKLHNLTAKQPKKVSPDTLLASLTHILGIAVIVYHERANVITSKALGFVTKIR